MVAGAWGHRRVREILDARDAAAGIVLCPACSGRLRLPVSAGRLSVTCPRCGHRFDRDAGGPSLPRDWAAEVASLKRQRLTLVGALCACIVVAVLLIRLTFRAASEAVKDNATAVAEGTAKGGYVIGYIDGHEGRSFSTEHVLERLRAAGRAAGTRPLDSPPKP
jgi:hypothetical protein